MQDAENNTILLLLAGIGNTPNAAYRSSTTDVDLRDAALRMATLYIKRYPFIVDWSNAQGKTALHVATIKGNEEFVRVRCHVLSTLPTHLVRRHCAT